MNPSKNYIKMCSAALEIQELKFVREIKDDEYGEIFREYLFEKNDCCEHLGTVQINDSKWLYTVSRIMYESNTRVHWIPTFEQCLKIYSDKELQAYAEIDEFNSESLALLWLSNFIEDKVKEDHGFCFTYQTKEEIALLWVMEKVYGKIWSGEQWIQNI